MMAYMVSWQLHLCQRASVECCPGGTRGICVWITTACSDLWQNTNVALAVILKKTPVVVDRRRAPHGRWGDDGWVTVGSRASARCLVVCRGKAMR